MSSEVKRYAIISDDWDYVESPSGGFVDHDDYAALEVECERLRMQLVACGVVALANTPESAAKARDMHPDYMSASCQDVMRAVDSEIALRAELSALKAQQAGQELDELRRACAEILGQDPEAWPSHGNAPLAIASALALAVSTAPQPAPAQDVAGWIPVTERLPEVAQEVIVSTEFEGVCAGILDSYGEWFAPCSEYKLTRVTHWMPLPPAPESPK